MSGIVPRRAADSYSELLDILTRAMAAELGRITTSQPAFQVG